MTDKNDGAGTESTGERNEFPRYLFIASALWIIVLLLAITVFCSQFSQNDWWSIMGSCLILGGAAAAGGAFAGFLFAVPKSLQSSGSGLGESQFPKGADTETKIVIANNSNLEQISDWLTKILVGVGLVELNQVPSALGSLAAFLRPVLGDTAASGAFGVGLLIYSFLVAFLLAYMWTRTRFFQVLIEYTRFALEGRGRKGASSDRQQPAPEQSQRD